MHVGRIHDAPLMLLLVHVQIIYWCVYNWRDLNIVVELRQSSCRLSKQHSRIHVGHLRAQDVCHRKVIVIRSRATAEIHARTHLLLIYHRRCRRCWWHVWYLIWHRLDERLLGVLARQIHFGAGWVFDVRRMIVNASGAHDASLRCYATGSTRRQAIRSAWVLWKERKDFPFFSQRNEILFTIANKFSFPAVLQRCCCD